MISKIIRRNSTDLLIWSLMAFYVLIAHWFWFGRGIMETILILAMVVMIIKRLPTHVSKDFMTTLLFLLFFVCSSTFVTITSSSTKYFGEDIKAIGGGLIAAIYLVQLYTCCPKLFSDYMDLSRRILNTYMVINTIIIFIQYVIPYAFMYMPAVNHVGNFLYMDLLTGFIGINGTTRWNVLTCWLLIMNYSYAQKTDNKKMLYYNGAFTLVSLYVSWLNGARSFMIFLPIHLLLYFFYIRRDGVKAKIKYVNGIIFLFLIGVYIYNNDSFVQEYINELVDSKVNIYMSSNLQTLVENNDDRGVAVYYAMGQGGLFGKGIGSIPMHASLIDVKYIGLNSASSYIYMIGLIGYLLLSVVLGSLMAFASGKRNNIFTVLLFSLVWVIFSYLIPIYSYLALIFGTITTFLYEFNENRLQKNENRNLDNLWRK